MNILVTGGVGYIGSHTIIELIESGYSVVVADNLSNSNIEALHRVEKITKTKIPFYKIDIRDKQALDKLFADNKIDSVIHFAGLKSVGESVKHPVEYYDNNLISTVVLLEIMIKHNVKKLVFSSTAGVYGEPIELPLKESSLVGVGIFSPYGRTKYMIEEILNDLSFADKSLEIVILRYFNLVGAHESGLIGEDPNGIPDNILPYISQVAAGLREKVNVFGDDYETPDGTGVRDYIHVVDLAKGHIAALKHIKQGVNTYNLGSGIGVSVLDLLNAYSRAIGKDVPYEIVTKRPNDVSSNYSNADKAWEDLHWKTERSLERACEDSWRWQSNNPNGYRTS